MNVREKLLAREKECFDFLKAVPEKTKYVLIGGYAVSSYGFPRFSVDLDIVIPESELKFFEKLVEERGFVLTTERKDLDEIYSGYFRSYGKKEELPVSVDLLPEFDSLFSVFVGKRSLTVWCFFMFLP